MTGSLRAARLLLAFVSAVCASSGVVAQEVGYTGTFQIQWGDPPQGGTPIQLYLLFADAGGTIQLDFSATAIEEYGPLHLLNGKRVQVSGIAGPAPSAERGGVVVPRVQVQSLVAAPGPNALLRPVQDALAAAAASVSRPYVTILCRFADSPTVMPGTKDYYERLMGNAYPGVDHYWRETSDGQMDLQGSVVVGWYDLPQPRSYYVGTGSFAADNQLLQNDCAAAADADVHFPSFSGVNFQFNQWLDCCSWGGGGVLELDGERKIYGMTWMASWASMGTYAHEVGHSIGLPHSGGPYGRVYDSQWDVMSSASWVHPAGAEFSFGAQTIAYHKDLQGWIPDARRYEAVAPRSTVLLERSALPAANGNPLLIRVPIAGSNGSFYTVEARRPVGYDAPLPDGVVIHCVNCAAGEPAQVVDADGNGNVNDAGSLWTVGERFLDLRNGITITVDSLVDGAYSVTVAQGTLLSATLSRSGHARTVAFGTDTTFTESVVVGVAGASLPAGVQWSASTSGRRPVLSTVSGGNGGELRWTSHTAGLGAGVYVDTIRVQLPEPSVPAFYVDTLVVTAPPVVAVGVARTSASGKTAVNLWTGTDSVQVRLSGPGADTVSWRATRSASWVNFMACVSYSNGSASCAPTTELTGTGSGFVRWRRVPHYGLAPGIYVDTLRIAAAAQGSPAMIIDTMRVVAPPTLDVSPQHASATLPEGTRGAIDSVSLHFNEDWNDATYYVQTMAPGHLRVRGGPWETFNTGTGSAVVEFERDATGLPPGVYVDTLEVYSSVVTERYLVDTLTVIAAERALRLGSPSRSGQAVLGQSQSVDSVLVMPQGPGTGEVLWVASSRKSRTTFISRDAFTGPGRDQGTKHLRWIRNTAGLPPGWSVDTITVAMDVATETGTVRLSATLLDSLQVLGQAALVPAASGRHHRVFVNAALPPDSARVEIEGYLAEEARWEAGHRGTWLTLAAAAGVGPGWLRWTRSSAGLAPGLHVDTIDVRGIGMGGGPWQVVDSVVVMAPVVITTTTLRPAELGAAYADTLEASGGDGTYRWSIAAGELPAGLELDSIGGRISGTARLAGSYTFTVRARSAGGEAAQGIALEVVEPARIIAAASGRHHAVLAGTALPPDSARVDIEGFYAAEARWAASHRASWLTLAAAEGMGPGWVRWTRSSTGLAPGLYIDTIAVQGVGIGGGPWQVVDSLVVLAPVAIVTTTMRPAELGAGYADTLTATGGDGTYRWGVTGGALPAGLALDSIAGLVSGTAQTAGRFTFTVRVRSAGGETSRALTLDVLEPARIVSDSVRPAGVVGVPYSDTLRAAGGTGQWRWRLEAGPLPAGLALDSLSGAVHGVPEQPASAHFTVRATSGQQSAARAFALTVTEPVLQPTAILDHLLGGQGLTANELRFLDLIGNRNNRLDVGDVRAWLLANRQLGGEAMTELRAVTGGRQPEEEDR